MKFFNDQQLSAIDSRNHTLVSAGAGTGKTSVLVERYIGLIHQNTLSVENILCLTFTRKAAREMYERVYRRLGSEDADKHMMREYKRFDRARITTIDGFCSSIVKEYMGEFGYPHQYRLADRTFKAELESFLLRYVSEGKKSPILAELMKRFSPETIMNDLLMKLATERAGVLPGETDMFQKFISICTQRFNAAVRKLPENLSDLEDALHKQKGNTANSEKETEGCNRISRSLEALEEIEFPVAEYGEDTAGEFFSAMVDLHSGLNCIGFRKKLWKPFKHLRDELLETDLLPLLFILRDRNFYREYYGFCEGFIREIREFKRVHGVVEYSDYLKLAVHILFNYPDVADQFRREIKFIMIDEFQDNNELQKQLLFLLAAEEGFRGSHIPRFSDLRPGVLFFVGDQKQSIYRFRGADVSVFRNLSQEMPSESQNISLDTNYRSSRQLIQFYNAFFPLILNGGEDYEADYHPLQSGSKTGELPSSIEFHFLPELRSDPHLPRDTPLGDKAAEAYYTARKIREFVERGSLLIPGGNGECSRPVQYGDIAILYDKSSIQFELEKNLRRQGVPYRSENTRSLFLDAPAYDTYSFLKLCISPRDNMAQAALLRSPVVNLGDDAITELISRDMFGADPDSCKAAGIELREDQVCRYRKILDLKKDITPMIDREQHGNVLARFWTESGYAQFIAEDRRRSHYMQHFDYLLEYFDLYNGRPMEELLEDLEKRLGTAESEDEISLYSGDGKGVQLMTVHKSKGLEFPVVFLAYTNSRKRHGGEAAAPMAILRDGLPALNAGFSLESIRTEFSQLSKPPQWLKNPLILAGKEQDEREEEAEKKRLLYVALTRAEQHLFINVTGTSASGATSGSFAHLLMTGLSLEPAQLVQMEPGRERSLAVGDSGLRIVRYPRPGEEEGLGSVFSGGAGDSKIYTGKPALTLSGPPAALRLPGFCRRSFAVTQLQSYINRGNVKFSSRSDDDGLEAAVLGTEVHKILEKALLSVARGGEFIFPAEEEFAGKNTAEILLQSRAREIASAFLGFEEAEKIKGASRFEVEYPFIMAAGEITLHGKIDLLYGDSERVWIIDFKSGGHVNTAEYQLQLDCYREAAHRLGWKSVTCGIADLLGGRMVWRDKEYNADEISRWVADFSEVATFTI